MDMVLTRKKMNQHGIFGVLSFISPLYGSSFQTLEHSYEEPEGTFSAKTPDGIYTCQRGLHQLVHGTLPFITYEVMNVPKHTGILFHVGNYNRDSDGCILIGELWPVFGICIHESEEAFKRFMRLQPEPSFQLTIQEDKS